MNIIRGNIPVYCKIFIDDRIGPQIRIKIKDISQEKQCCEHAYTKEHDQAKEKAEQEEGK